MNEPCPLTREELRRLVQAADWEITESNGWDTSDLERIMKKAEDWINGKSSQGIAAGQ